MVRAGFAAAYRRYSNDYVDEESEARTARRGIWAGEFTPPEDYRSETDANDRAARSDALRDAATRGATAATSKATSTRDGERIYHTPGSPSYDDTVIDESERRTLVLHGSRSARRGLARAALHRGGSR